ncbi:hypothetical protein [Nocardioides astragali]|uniref:Uncharacterized protein n=1 Tax=Nocardioides astragali TaxID=1776736 RepID=A0ABW2MWL2_9ACTN|nr:hypothetical protein [Nocardioides astragali]
MGFDREARRVRDASLPDGYRLHALGSCIQLAQPIGFNATWSYLTDQLQSEWRDPRILSPAINLLEAERTAHLSICTEYAASRRFEKAGGLRFPPRSHVTPRDPMRWHGDERSGARHVLMSWSQRGRQFHIDVSSHPVGRGVIDAIEIALEGGALAGKVNDLQSALEWARRQIHVIGWQDDEVQYRAAWSTYRLLGQLHLLTHGATRVATPWNFVTTE